MVSGASQEHRTPGQEGGETGLVAAAQQRSRSHGSHDVTPIDAMRQARHRLGNWDESEHVTDHRPATDAICIQSKPCIATLPKAAVRDSLELRFFVIQDTQMSCFLKVSLL